MRFDIRSFADEDDQREALLKSTKAAVAGIELLRNRVLVATYVGRAKSKGGIIIPNKTLDENRFQGKVGLILKLGPIAFDFGEELAPVKPGVGDWVFYNPSDAGECGVQIVGSDQGVLCRRIFDDQIVGIISDPELIW